MDWVKEDSIAQKLTGIPNDIISTKALELSKRAVDEILNSGVDLVGFSLGDEPKEKKGDDHERK